MLTADRKRRIENEAIRLRTEIHDDRAKYWPGGQAHGFDIINPQIAAKHLGYEMQFVPELALPFQDAPVETAGVLDKRKKWILVSDCFGRQVRMFTASHELGHIVLDHPGHQLHRDFPIAGLEQEPRDPIEREANYFAGCFLIPPKFLAKFVASMFGAAPFKFDYAAAHHFSPGDPGQLLHAPQGSLARYKAIASAKSYAGRPFGNHLADFFKVSVTTMAIRLRELELVEDSVET